MSTFEERAAARRNWPVVKASLETEDDAAVLDGNAAWDAVMELTWQAYSLAGLMTDPLPRSQWPATLFRPGEKRPDSHGL